ncbi:hypothetical protein [Halalkalibacter krulwichiae]|uniref:HEPN domain-containing protein n=1 Tax=Halalkalibacter krulwichiae TaxID=199441 RepID=A0A1X9MGZ0_9BACI|nr:hypothetical protein [Halalkalibacter krulwichiae]ARK29702.1 hypothetical protein BkAM31D_07405 [Halalkalibacter krulwichiae]
MIWPREKANFEFVEKNSLHILKVKNSDDIQKEFYLYSENFLSSANLLINHALNTNENRKKDFWLFGIVYLYRQSLELLLKSIAFKYLTEVDDKKEFIGNVRHNLKDAYAYDEISVLLQEDDITLSDNEGKWLDEYLTDISELDEQSDMFRYPFNFKMARFFKVQTHINLRALGTNMNSAYKMLTGMLYQVKEGKQDELIVYKPKFLIEDGSYYDQGVIWKGFSNDFYPYIEGYMEGANYLCKMIMENKKDYLFLPMCYMYRNGIELALKRILVEDCQFDFKTVSKKLKNRKHSIEGLWNVIKDHIGLRANAPDDDTTLIIVELYIKQLHNIDTTSSKFRYPIDKYLKLHFKKEKKYDVVNISLCFNELFRFLDAVDGMLTSQNEALTEMALEAQQASEWDYNPY